MLLKFSCLIIIDQYWFNSVPNKTNQSIKEVWLSAWTFLLVLQWREAVWELTAQTSRGTNSVIPLTPSAWRFEIHVVVDQPHTWWVQLKSYWRFSAFDIIQDCCVHLLLEWLTILHYTLLNFLFLATIISLQKYNFSMNIIMATEN